MAVTTMAATPSASAPTPGSVRAWVLASRPKTLVCAFVPVAVGAAVAHQRGEVAWLPVLAALLGAVFIQIGTNFANDLFDAIQGADTEERLGPTRAVASGLLSRGAMRNGIVVAFGLATACGAYLVSVAGWPIVAIGVVSILSGLAYTGGPYPLGYHGLGDVFVLVFFGPVAVCGTTLVASGSVPSTALLASIPVGALATAILVVNNVRDRETDVKANKRTLAVRFGRRAGELEQLTLLGASYVCPIALALVLESGWPLLPLLTAPLGLAHYRELLGREGTALNATLAGAARLLAVHGVLLAVGIALA
jgi:1,4-dihydroxy-2-naphthoate polyprenyltransferase